MPTVSLQHMMIIGNHSVNVLSCVCVMRGRNCIREERGFSFECAECGAADILQKIRILNFDAFKQMKVTVLERSQKL